MAKEVHVIPVPSGMTPEQAWAEISLLGELVEQRHWWRRLFRGRTWAVIEVGRKG